MYILLLLPVKIAGSKTQILDHENFFSYFSSIIFASACGPAISLSLSSVELGERKGMYIVCIRVTLLGFFICYDYFISS